MTNSNNIPTFNDICGTVTQSLAETIINREAIIAELRERLAQTQETLRERCANYAELHAQNNELRKEIEGWREECECNERYIKELETKYSPMKMENIRSENIRLTAQRDEFEAHNKRLKTALTVTENSHRDIDAQCKNLLLENERLKKELANSSQDFGRGDAYWTAIRERDDARMLYCEFVAEDRRRGLVDHEDCTPHAIAMEMGWDSCSDDKHTPCLFANDICEDANPLRTRRSDFVNQQQSDSDPVTGVQYGDLV